MTRHVIAAFIAAFLFPFAAHAESGVASEMSTTNGINEMVLTTQPCPVDHNHGFEMYAYVLEEEMTVAEGCWVRHEGYVDIWIPAIKSHFQLKAEEFTPRITM